jgi:GT2 family glycosyltransferase
VNQIMEEPLVSVVIPAYNRAHCLGATIQSALVQTHANLEVLVIDDGSTDQTASLMKGLAVTDGRIRYLPQANGGVSVARNHGFRSARGSVIALLDSEDTYEPWKIELAVACLQADPAVGMIWTDMTAIDAQGKEMTPACLRSMYHGYRWFPTTERLFSRSHPLESVAPGLVGRFPVLAGRRFASGEIYSQMIMGSLVHTSTVVLRRERLDLVAAFREEPRRPGDDYEFHLRTCREGPVGFIDVASIRYRFLMPDRLTHPSHGVHLARTFLETIEGALACDRARIHLPPAMLAAAQAEAHAWLGEMELERGDSVEARFHLARSLHYVRWQPRVMRLLAATALPPPVRRAVRTGLRAARLRLAVAWSS